ncbi:MAG: DUF6279 family lipoprotein [Rhodoferax sp.]|nr:DUF6279 family lipoprotein [Rhodoferax sp.]
MRCPAYLSLCKNLLGIISLGVLLLGLQSCSTIGLAYNQAPLVLDWYLDDYVDFNGAQKPVLQNALQQVHVWHRQTQLPAYIDSLQKMQRQITEPLTPARACEFYDEIQGQVLRTLQGVVRLEQSGTAAIGLQKLANLDASQLAHMERKFAKVNRKYREDYLSGTPQQLREKRFDKALERTEMLYGKLNERQQSMLQKSVAQSNFDPQRAYAESQRRQQDLLQTLRSLAAPAEPSAAQAAAALEGVLNRAFLSPDLNYRREARQTKLYNCQAFAELHNSTTPAQRQLALTRLQGYEQDVRALLR